MASDIARLPLSPALRRSTTTGASKRDAGTHYEKLRAAGKTAKQALIACTRKLLVILNAMLRDKTRWTVA